MTRRPRPWRRGGAPRPAELRALGREEARLLGFEYVSERTLRRLAANYRRFGPIGCIDGRWLRRRSGHRISEQVREAIHAVHAETLHRSKVSMRTREWLIHQYVRERFGPGVELPTYETLRVVWAEWFGPGGARQRYLRSAAAVEPSTEHVVVHRPGQVVALDTTVLPVKVREHVFGEAVSVHLTLALDVYTHSLVAFRLTLVSDTAVDVAMLLRDMTMPLPLQDGWGEDMEWPYPGIPAAVVAEFAGHRVAGLPFSLPRPSPPTTARSTRTTTWSRCSGCLAATSCPLGCCGPPTSRPWSGHSARSGACCLNCCSATRASMSPTAAQIRRATRC